MPPVAHELLSIRMPGNCLDEPQTFRIRPEGIDFLKSLIASVRDIMSNTPLSVEQISVNGTDVTIHVGYRDSAEEHPKLPLLTRKEALSDRDSASKALAKRLTDIRNNPDIASEPSSDATAPLDHLLRKLAKIGISQLVLHGIEEPIPLLLPRPDQIPPRAKAGSWCLHKSHWAGNRIHRRVHYSGGSVLDKGNRHASPLRHAVYRTGRLLLDPHFDPETLPAAFVSAKVAGI